MSHHVGQTSSKLDSHSEKLQLAVLTQQNRRLMHEILPLKITQYQHQDELHLQLNTAKQLNYHFFAVEQQPLLFLPDRASKVSRTAFLSYFNEIYGAQLIKGSIIMVRKEVKKRIRKHHIPGCLSI